MWKYYELRDEPGVVQFYIQLCGCNSTFNYADYMAEFGLNSKMSHLIQQKITILHENYSNFDQKCIKKSENADYV